MYIIAPLSNCASPEKRDSFLGYISKIAPVTLANEPQCLGYAWFRSAGDNDVVPTHWVRGFEIYETIPANQVTHRASEEYKAFRAACGSEGLLAKPSDLRFWRPTGIGHLTRGGAQNRFLPPATDPQYIVTKELNVKGDKKTQVLEVLRGLVDSKAGIEPETFWVLDRGEGCSETEKREIFILLRFTRKTSYVKFRGELSKALETVDECCEHVQTTTWNDAGVGFLGR